MMLIAGMQSLGDPERLTRLRGIIERARAELDAFLRENGGQSSASGGAEGDSGPIEQL